MRIFFRVWLTQAGGLHMEYSIGEAAKKAGTEKIHAGKSKVFSA